MRKYIGTVALYIIIFFGMTYLAVLSLDTGVLHDRYIPITIDHNTQYFEVLDVHKSYENDSYIVRFKNTPEKYYAIKYFKVSDIYQTSWLSEWVSEEDYEQILKSTTWEPATYRDGMFDALHRDVYDVRVADATELVLNKSYKIVDRDAYVIFYDSSTSDRYALVFRRNTLGSNPEWVSNILDTSEWDIYYHNCQLVPAESFTD